MLLHDNIKHYYILYSSVYKKKKQTKPIKKSLITAD